MNADDRVFMRRAARCARAASSSPDNPANVAGVVQAARQMERALSALAFALGTRADDQGDISDIETLERELGLTA